MSVALAPQTNSLEWLASLHAVLDAPFDPSGLPPAQLRQTAAEIARLKARLDGRSIAVARELENSQVAKKLGATSTGALISHDFGGDVNAGNKLVRTAKQLERATLTDSALSTGAVTYEQAGMIAKAVTKLPHDLDRETRTRVENTLIHDAQKYTVKDLRRRITRIADLYETPERADLDENQNLEARERSALAKSEFWMIDQKDGTYKGGFTIPEAQADFLKTALDAVAAPRRAHLTHEEGLFQDEFTYGQRLGRAFIAWIEHLPTDGFATTGGTPAVITVNLDYKHLCEQIAPATLSTGTRISTGEARRLACEQQILPQVLDGDSVILDHGRSQRLFSKNQRLIYAQRDLGCAFPGCDRPPGWCESHHLRQSWAAGGTTDLADGVLLCPHHHRHVHHQSYDIRIRNTLAEFRKSGTSAWVSNRRWRPKQTKKQNDAPLANGPASPEDVAGYE